MSASRRELLQGLAAIGAVGCGSGVVEREAPGIHEISDQIRGKRRRALLIVPPGLSGLAPMFFGMHDTGADPEGFSEDSGWRAECERRGWLGIFPAYTRGDRREDNAYLAHLITRGAALGGGDPARVFVVGHGAGGRRAYALGCSNPGLVAAIGAVGAVVRFEGEGLGFQDPQAPVSVIHLHGTLDTEVPLSGGPIACADGKVRQALSASEGLKPWIGQLGSTPAGVPLELPPRVLGQQWAGEGHEVALLTDLAADHAWNPLRATPVISAFLARIPPR